MDDRVEDRAEDICDTTKWKDESKLVKVEACKELPSLSDTNLRKSHRSIGVA